MKKLLSVVVVGSALLAGCGAGSNALTAVVDGHEVTVGDVEALLFGDNSTVDRATFARNLGFKIQFIVITDAASDQFGYSPSEDEVAERAESLYNDLKTGEQTLEEFLEERSITQEMLTEVARQGLISEFVREEFSGDVTAPTEDEITEARQFAIAQLTNGCISHILVETEPEARDVLARLDQGEVFADLATELSTDLGSGANGGALGCSTFEQWVAPFRDASLGATVGEVVAEPVESQFGFHVILVTDRVDPEVDTIPTTEEITASLEARSLETLFSDWFFAAIETAEVTVEPEYGTWQSGPEPGVVPPTEE